MKGIFSFILLAFFMNTVHASTEVNVPFGPGGAVDIIARDLSEYLKKNNIETFVSNTPGAGGDVAYRHIMSKKDNIIMVTGHGPIVFSNLEQKRENIYLKNTKIIGPIFSIPQGFISAPTGFANFNELIASAKTNELPCAISNPQGTAELKKFNALHGTKFLPVPYKGSAELRNDIIGNHIRCGYDTLNSHYTVIKSEKVKLLAITQTEKDFSSAPLVKTLLPSGESYSWYAIVIPNDSNVLQNQKLLEAIKQYTQDPKVIASMKERGFSQSTINVNFDKFVNDLMKTYEPFFK